MPSVKSAAAPLPPVAVGGRDQGIGPLLDRIRGEFLEMPDLRLTASQAARFWVLDCETSERILAGLAGIGFLLRTRTGAYLRATVG